MLKSPTIIRISFIAKFVHTNKEFDSGTDNNLICTRTRHLPLYPGPGRRGSRDVQTFLSPDTSSNSSRGAQGVPRPAQRHSPSSVSWAILWASSQWDVPGTPPEEGIKEASNIDARATSTGSSRCGGAAALRQAPPGWPSSSPHL
ncbi:hypothetical protein CHARACLAT_033628 [Characodon lateralis]|uniref:Uncharacterized protein n=1 Tax=Characodon lateralis TaxID=208331 RepID=A0ABU7F8L1_9TELE|nr:hypothetical protein [Characodon lateralis]